MEKLIKSLPEKFAAGLRSGKLWTPGERWLVTSSGGVDSTALCHLLAATEIPFSVAHCNFQLRGEASDGDELFVKILAEQLGVPFFSKRFDTKKFASEQRLGIQEAARKLRYDWFHEILQVADCQRIATAHHLDDSIETVLFNFGRGCGIRGLHGILPKTGQLVRPLLFATKNDIREWAEQRQIEFREDASNDSDKYARNLIRHHAVPAFEKINPAFQKSAGETIARIREAEALFEFAVTQIHQKIVETTPDGWRLDTRKLLSYPTPSTVLFEWLHPLGFDEEQVRQILQSIENQPGKVFTVSSGRLLVDRFFIFFSLAENVGGGLNIDAIHARQSGTPTFRSEYPDLKVGVPEAAAENVGGGLNIDAIPTEPLALPGGGSLHFRQSGTPTFGSGRSDLKVGVPEVAYLDADRLEFPLILRHWQPGDVFQPIGMGGKRQKLQDYFSNRKLSVFEKEKAWLLESRGQICWVVGMRLDERFKVVENTKSCLEVAFRIGTFADDK